MRELQEPNSFVLDSYALIGYLENESFSDQIQLALNKAKVWQTWPTPELKLCR
jgi:hypothetical protein